MNKPVLNIGSDGPVAVLSEILRQVKRTITAIVSPDKVRLYAVFNDLKHLHNDDDILGFSPESIELVNDNEIVGAESVISKDSVAETAVFPDKVFIKGQKI